MIISFFIYNEYAFSRNSEYITITKKLNKKLFDTEKGFLNIVDAVVSTGSYSLYDKLKEFKETIDRH